MRRNHSSIVCLLLLSTLLTDPVAAVAQEWTRFRGPNGSGISTATTVPVRWTNEDYNWTATLPGVGHSSPVVWQSRIFLTCGDEQTGTRIVVCYDTATGQQLWSRKFPAAPHRKHKLNSFASPTPAVDAERVYVLWGTPDAITARAFDHDGKPLWDRDLGAFPSGHGFGVSPILWEDLVVVPVHFGEGSFRIALHRDTGETAWRHARSTKLHYATPCIWRRPGRADQLILSTWMDGICGVDPRTGEIAWSRDVYDKSDYEASIASPVTAGDLVIGSAGYFGRGFEVVAIRPDVASAESDDKPVWRIARGAPLCVTPLVVDDLLFIWSDQGVVTCVNVATGKVHWRKRIGNTYYASPICAGAYIYNVSVDGECVVLAASRDYRLVARNPLGEPSHATAAVSGGVMYLRTFTQLLSIGGGDSHRGQ